MTYKRLTASDRETIMTMRSQGKMPVEIAEQLHRRCSTITRELARHSTQAGTHSAMSAQCQAESKARQHHTQRKLDAPDLWRFVEQKVKLRWSPEQIAQALRAEYPEDESMRVSHETIYSYQYVQGRGHLKKEVTRYLRQHLPTRRPRQRRIEHRGKFLNMVSIHQRPPEVEERNIPGYWEGDLVMGARNQSALGTLVERKTRFVILVPLKVHDARSVRQAMVRNIRHLPEHLRRSMTYDQGKEMAEHEQFTIDSKMQVYFADPHSPWMRGTNENTNGLIRDFFPKGTDFSEVTHISTSVLLYLQLDARLHWKHETAKKYRAVAWHDDTAAGNGPPLLRSELN